ncbi:MAG: 50S ribosomal protein L11 methyltransferase [Solirubrobacteraceae bacterium]
MIRLAIRVRREDAELVLAELLELAPSGVEEAELGEGVIEYAVYGSPGELPELPDLRAAAGGALVEIATSELPDDWSERWKRFHRPVLIEAPVPVSRPASGLASRSEREAPSPHAARIPLPALHVRPPWEPPSNRNDVREIVIDPAQAFGTGAHATTRLCLELLLEVALRDDSRGPLLDIGTGSGVLAIAAAHLGYAPVLGLDNEPESVEAARANALVNGVDIDVRRFDLRVEPLPWAGKAGSSPRTGDAPSVARAGDMPPVVMANLLRPLLLDLARLIPAAPRHLLAGGLLAHEVDEVVQAFEAFGLREHERRHMGEWAAVWLRGGAPHFSVG